MSTGKKHKKKRSTYRKSSRNFVTDRGLSHSKRHQLKTALNVQLRRVFAERDLTQSAAARQMGLNQPDLSNLLGGRLQGYSVEKLIHMLMAFEQDVEIRIKPRRTRGKVGRIKVTATM